jgi:hypothetical protein
MTSKLPPLVRDKLAKLLPMPSSDHDGERIATVAAIERVLKSKNLGWLDLAAQVITTEPVQERPPEPQSGPKGHLSAEMDSDDLVDFIEELRDSGFTFDERSGGFLASMLGRARTYDTVFISEKQKKWLANLAAKAGVEMP